MYFMVSEIATTAVNYRWQNIINLGFTCICHVCLKRHQSNHLHAHVHASTTIMVQMKLCGNRHLAIIYAGFSPSIYLLVGHQLPLTIAWYSFEILNDLLYSRERDREREQLRATWSHFNAIPVQSNHFHYLQIR